MGMKNSILITGASGFLGTALVEKYISQDYKVIALAQSEGHLAELKIEFPLINTYVADIGHDRGILELIFEKYDLEGVIHCAAMKRIEVAQKQPTKAIQTNIVGTLNLLDLSKKNGVKRFIAISSDKAMNPKGVYGMSKYLMEQAVLEYGYDVFQGINFFASTGSVIPIWHKQMKAGKELTLTNPEHIRYFQVIEEVVEDIEEIYNLPQNRIHLPDLGIEVRMGDLLDAFMDYTSYNNFIVKGELDIEKCKEETLEPISCTIPTHAELKNLLDEYYFQRL